MDEFASDLTPRQKSVLAYITDYQRRFAIAPTVREICAHLGLKSPGGIHRILNILREHGYISAEADKKRSWRSLKPLPGGGIPLIGDIAGGPPIEAVQHLEETLAISPELFGCEQCFGLRVRGDSMTGAHIVDGDLAIIRVQQRVENGQIAAVLVQDIFTEATLKIVRRKGNILMLEPANRRYKVLAFKGVERRRVTILGKLAGVVRRSY
jgi:repressor LexA